MNANLRYVIAIGAALGASAAYAQTSDTAPSTVNQPAHKASPPPTCLPAPKQISGNGTGGEPFAAKQSVAQWRAPKLIGVAVYSADHRRVGVVKDVLIGHDGAVQVVVIGVGGFLGLGAKDVGVPFDSVEWRTEGRVVPTHHPTVNPLSASNTAGGQPAPRKIDAAAAEASQGYPDKALLKVTLTQLQSAPNFHYAPNPVATIEPPTGGGSMRSTSP
jgi:sporulation protein YlmC with PRC-barrel domain